MIGISCENASTLQLPQSQGLMMSQSVLFLSKGEGVLYQSVDVILRRAVQPSVIP